MSRRQVKKVKDRKHHAFDRVMEAASKGRLPQEPRPLSGHALADRSISTGAIDGRADHSNSQKLIVEKAAAAPLDLIRIGRFRQEMLATMDLATATPKQLQRLLAIDRYESRARTRRRRASARLEQDG